MKIRDTICAVLLAAAAHATLQAQAPAQHPPDAKDTAEWLMAHSGWVLAIDYLRVEPESLDLQACKVWLVGSHRCMERGRVAIAIRQIRSVAVEKEQNAHFEDGQRLLRIHVRYASSGTGSNEFNIVFTDTTSSDDVHRYAKALSHLAELNGANLLKDDAF